MVGVAENTHEDACLLRFDFLRLTMEPLTIRAHYQAWEALAYQTHQTRVKMELSTAGACIASFSTYVMYIYIYTYARISMDNACIHLRICVIMSLYLYVNLGVYW